MRFSLFTFTKSLLYGFYPFFQVFGLFVLEDVLNNIVGGKAFHPVVPIAGILQPDPPIF